MQDIQAIFNDLQKVKDEQKRIRRDYADMCKNDQGYQQIKDSYEEARRKKKDAETHIKTMMGGTYERLEELKTERAAMEEMLSDIAITQMMKGESVTIADADHNEYEPVYKVTFRRR